MRLKIIRKKIRGSPRKRVVLLTTKHEYVIFTIILILLLIVGTIKNAFAAEMVIAIADTGTKDLSATFLDIVKCAGKIAFMFGYVDFTNAIAAQDGGAMFPPLKKMLGGITLNSATYFLKKSSIYSAISGGKAVGGIGTLITTIVTVIDAAISAYGVMVLARGLMDMGTAIGDRDIVGVKRGLLAGISGILAGGCGALMAIVGF